MAALKAKGHRRRRATPQMPLPRPGQRPAPASPAPKPAPGAPHADSTLPASPKAAARIGEPLAAI
jgi:hypothetical protein